MSELENLPGLKELKGAFVGSLVRNNKKIREDRAISIAESAEMKYKRMVEDLGVDLKQLRRDREAMLDMSPENAMSLVLASDFDGDVFVVKDIDLGIKIRNLEIKLDIAKARYEHLFTSNE